jgi:hypothetical protein
VLALTLAAAEFTLLPDPVDVGFVGTGSAVGGVAGGMLAYAHGYAADEIVSAAALAAVIGGASFALWWLLGLTGVEWAA